MTQKAQHTYQDDYQMAPVSSSSSSTWIWAGLAALAVLGLAVWLMASTGPSSGPVTSAPQTEQIAPPPAAPAPEAEPAPAPAPAPAAPPAQ